MRSCDTWKRLLFALFRLKNAFCICNTSRFLEGVKMFVAFESAAKGKAEVLFLAYVSI